MTDRIIAVGDIHGCAIALAALLHAIDIQPSDTIIGLGDYVDRGPDSKGVLEQLIALSQRCRLVPLLGNHDEMMLCARYDSSEFDEWLLSGGDKTLASYGQVKNDSHVPTEHIRFLEQCDDYFETETHFFTHANYEADLALDEQVPDMLRWKSLRVSVPGPHCSGKIAIVGHTPQLDDVLDLGYLICLDTGCCYGRWLTAMDIASGKKWQVDSQGRPKPIT